MAKPEIITKKSYKYWGLLSDLITFTIPIVYLIIQYNIFKKGDMQITVVAWIILIMLVAFSKKFISKFILDIRENFGKVAKRITLTTTLLILTILFLFSSIWIKDLVLLLGVFVVSLSISMYPFYKYTKNKERYDRLKGVSQNEKDKQAIKSGDIIVK